MVYCKEIMAKRRKILILGIIAAIVVVAVLMFAIDWNDFKIKRDMGQEKSWREELDSILEKSAIKENDKITKTLRNFADKINQCQNFGKQAALLDFELIDKSIPYESFDDGYIKDEIKYPSEIKSEVAVFRDNDEWAGKINEYEVDLKKYSIGEDYEVVSMYPADNPKTNYDSLSADELSGIRGEEKALYTINLIHSSYKFSDEAIRKDVESSIRRCLADLIKYFDKIDTSYTFTHTIEVDEVGNADNDSRYKSQKHTLIWDGDDYTDRAGFVPITPPFLKIVATNSGHIISYESNLSFFRYSTIK